MLQAHKTMIPVTRRKLLASIGALAPLAGSYKPKILSPIRTNSHIPRRSDVCFSARSARKEAAKVASEFYATRLDWCYTSDPRFIHEMSAVGLKSIGGAISPTISDAPGSGNYRAGRIKDRNGERLVAPWMRSQNPTNWGCVNNPIFKENFFNYATSMLKSGIDCIQWDDSLGNAHAVKWGGCWCQYCLTEARHLGFDPVEDMMAFQTQSTKHFILKMRNSINQWAGKIVNFSTNNYNGNKSNIYDLFDFWLGELTEDKATPENVSVLLRSAEQANKQQIWTLRSSNIAHNRSMIAWCYANGGHLLAPWDVYLEGVGNTSKRFYGEPSNFADLYRFARSLGNFLDEANAADFTRSILNSSDPNTHLSYRRQIDSNFGIVHVVAWKANTTSIIEFQPKILLSNATRFRVRIPDKVGPWINVKQEREKIEVRAHPWSVIEIS